MLRLRDRDGAAFVMEMGDVKAAFERAGDDGPDLRRALKLRMAMQAGIGMPEDRVRLLTSAEAGAPAGAGLGGSRPGATARLQAASGRPVSSDWAAPDFPPAGRRCTVAPAAGFAATAVRGA